MSSVKPKCYGKLPRPEFRGVSCGECKRFDACAWESLPKNLEKRGIHVERVKVFLS